MSQQFQEAKLQIQRSMNKVFLTDLERKALAKRREGACREELDLWLELVRFDPTGNMEWLSTKSLVLGAKASLEYLHGDRTEALELYFALAYTYKSRQERVDRIRPAIYELGTGLGLNQTTIATLLAEALKQIPKMRA